MQNRGAAFGILSDADLPYQSLLFSVVSLLALGGDRRLRLAPARAAAGCPSLALALIMGGAVGNLSTACGSATSIDFVDVYWGAHHWPAFNVADSAISVGVGLLCSTSCASPQTERRRRRPSIDAATRRREDRLRCTRGCSRFPPSSSSDARSGPLTLHTYGVLLAIAFLAGLWVAAPAGASAPASTPRASPTWRSTSSSRA